MQPASNHHQIIDSEEARIAQAAADAAGNLTAEQIDASKFYIKQRYERYSEENHAVWRELYDRRWTVLEEQASNVFLSGIRTLNMTRDRVPKLDGEGGINTFLKPLTGWQSRPVPGYLPQKAFFACLSRREFPTTITVRPREQMDYLPEPDIFHDVFGHVPLHADPVFADFLQTYGRAALLCNDEEHIKRLGRLFWFTVEFGLIREDNRVKIYGSGLISSHAESDYALNSAKPERRPFDLERVCETDFEIDSFQPIYYVLESFEQLRDAMNNYATRVLGISKAKTLAA
jgi:phenylalanine-4-hydroxylase